MRSQDCRCDCTAGVTRRRGAVTVIVPVLKLRLQPQWVFLGTSGSRHVLAQPSAVVASPLLPLYTDTDRRTRQRQMPDDEYVTVAQAAHLSGLSRRQLQWLLQHGAIPGIRPGRDWLVRPSAVMTYLKERRRPGRPRRARLPRE